MSFVSSVPTEQESVRAVLGRYPEQGMYLSKLTDIVMRTGESAEKFNALVKEARAELDDAKRKDMYFECQRLIHDDGGAIVPMFANYINGIDKKVAHAKAVAANWDIDGQKASERWWFA